MSLHSPAWSSLRLFVAVGIFGLLAMSSPFRDSTWLIPLFLVVAIGIELAFWRAFFRRRRQAVIDTRPPEERDGPPP